MNSSAPLALFHKGKTTRQLLVRSDDCNFGSDPSEHPSGRGWTSSMGTASTAIACTPTGQPQQFGGGAVHRDDRWGGAVSRQPGSSVPLLKRGIHDRLVDDRSSQTVRSQP